jgi:hypothetical protein
MRTCEVTNHRERSSDEMKDERRKNMENNDKVHDAIATTYSVGVINRKRKSKNKC